MSRVPLPFENAKHVAHMAAVVFGTGGFVEEVAKVIERESTPDTFVPFSVSEFLTYLSKTTWVKAWEWGMQVDRLLQTMAHERVLTEVPSLSTSALFGRRYLHISGVTPGQVGGDLWMAPSLGIPLLMHALRPSLIHLTGVNTDGDVRGGTGLALSPRHILTARHVIDDMKLDSTLVVPQVAGESAAEIQVSDQARHETHDLAVITVDDSDAQLAPPGGVASREPDWSDTIHLLGFPPIPMAVQAEPTVQTGEVVNPAISTYDGADLFLYSAVARPGNSGGPIFGRDGRLVGMVTRELAHQGAETTPASFYAGLPARVIHGCLGDLGFGDLLVEETWD